MTTEGLEMDANKGWLLKILTGPHVGSEAVLSPGVYLLGRDEACDIILHDTSLEDKHFQLTVAADKIGLRILSKERQCYADGIAIDSDSIEVSPYQVISTGTFFFALGSAQEAWPPIELLGVGRGFEQAEEETSEEPMVNSDEQSALSSPPFSISMVWQRLWSNKWLANRSYLSVSIALIGIGISLLFITFTGSDVSRKGLESQTVEIDELIADYVIDATVRTLSKDGRKMLYIHGYTKTDEQRSAFMEALGKAEISAQTQLYSAERLRLAVSIILSQFLDTETDSVEVTGVSGFPGKVMLSGYVEQSDVWERVLEMIKMDVPGLQDYDNRVRTMDDAVQAIRRMLSDQKLSDKVDVNTVEHTIYLSSRTLSESEQRRLTELSKNFQKDFGNSPQLAYEGKGEPQIKKFEIDIAIQSISFGESPYLETLDGKRYIVGAVLDGNYIIKEINRMFILLSKDGEIGRYYFNKQASPSAP